ncbi:hypothetical protein VP1G_06231 [Cytospora mali]|uniref:4-hydroxy-4-methyl-2-oxoglutarate aldolase n=1 Tax=Cytospora mali TaxID=578113 RepID=A0A194V4Z8_CYTMA|nr:hypothetical protein VP1G_06231 [Valsa mali var. pyri (nom. inval.)]
MVPGTPTEPGKPWNICGEAVTIRMCPYGGGLGPRMKPFVEYNEAGKIMVIETPDGQSGKYSACWGGIESLRAKIIGAQGVIVSGNMREVDDCREVGLPVLSRGVAALGTKQFMRLGKVNELITINGVMVRPDDVVLADAHGAVVVRQQRLEKVIEMCELRVQQKKLVRKDIENRKTMGDAIEHVKRKFGDPYDTFERNPRSTLVSTT